MRAIARNWRLLLALLLIAVAVLIFFMVYKPAEEDYQREAKAQNDMIGILMKNIQNEQADIDKTVQANLKYEPVQDELPEAVEQLKESRSALYELFPAEMREEDQIMYVVYLEKLLKEMEEDLDNDIQFSFADFELRSPLSDNSAFGGITLVVNYVTHYDTFKKLVDYLATDERITSVRFVTMDYFESYELLSGSLVLYLYMIEPYDYISSNDYVEPEVPTPEEIGKDSIFK